MKGFVVEVLIMRYSGKNPFFKSNMHLYFLFNYLLFTMVKNTTQHSLTF